MTEKEKHHFDITAKPEQVAGVKDKGLAEYMLGQVMETAWLGKTMAHDEMAKRLMSPADLMCEIGPKDAIEGMLASQMVATHLAAMECYRRAMIPEQGMEVRHSNLSQANKLTRSYAVLVEALNKHRGKGQQKIIVERVNVEPGGQAAFVGTMNQAPANQPEPPVLSYEPGTTMPISARALELASSVAGEEG